MGFTIYCSVFLVLGIISAGTNFAPIRGATYGFTFVSDEVVDKADKYCASTERCDAVCGTVGAPYNMGELMEHSVAAGALAFVGQLIGIFAMLTGIAGTVGRMPQLLVAFMVMLATAWLTLSFISAMLLSTSAREPFYAWFLERSDDADDVCTTKWVSDHDKSVDRLVAVMWTLWVVIVVPLALHMMLVAEATRKYIVDPTQTTRTVSGSGEVQISSCA